MTLAAILSPIWLPGAYIVVALVAVLWRWLDSRARIARRLKLPQTLQGPRPAGFKYLPRRVLKAAP